MGGESRLVGLARVKSIYFNSEKKNAYRALNSRILGARVQPRIFQGKEAFLEQKKFNKYFIYST